MEADQNINRDFKGVHIPKDIWCNTELDGDEKLMWGEIFALDNDCGCIAKNEHFMVMFGWANERKPQRVIKSLRDKGYITVENDKRFDRRTMHIVGKYRHLDNEEMENLLALRDQLLGSMTGKTTGGDKS